MIRILVTGGGGAGNEAIYRMLASRYDLHFADAEKSSIHPEIPPERHQQIPAANAPNFLGGITQLIHKLGINLVIPGVDEELLVLSDIEKSVINLKVLIPSTDYVSVMLDKFASVRTLADKGLDTPITELIENRNWSDYPCIAKPRFGRGSRGFQILNSFEQAIKYADYLDTVGEEVVIQEMLIGKEYTVMMVADQESRLHAVVPVLIKKKKGITISGIVDDNNDVIDTCANIHSAVPARGCYNIQLIHTDEGRIVPFEINPRISTTFCLGLAADVDPIDIFMSNTKPKCLASFTDNLELQRYWWNRIV